MDVTAGATQKIVTDIGVNVVGGGGLALLGGMGLRMRRWWGLPKRVKVLEDTSIIVLEHIGAQTKYLLAQNKHRRNVDKSDEVLAAEELLRLADEHLEQHFRNGLLGGGKS